MAEGQGDHQEEEQEDSPVRGQAPDENEHDGQRQGQDQVLCLLRAGQDASGKTSATIAKPEEAARDSRAGRGKGRINNKVRKRSLRLISVLGIGFRDCVS